MDGTHQSLKWCAIRIALLVTDILDNFLDEINQKSRLIDKQPSSSTSLTLAPEKSHIKRDLQAIEYYNQIFPEAGQETRKTAAIGGQEAQTQEKLPPLPQRLTAGQNTTKSPSRTQGALKIRGSTKTQSPGQVQARCIYQANYPIATPAPEDEANSSATYARSQEGVPSGGQGRSAEYSQGFADGFSQASGQAGVGQVLPDFIAALLGGSSTYTGSNPAYSSPSAIADSLSQRSRQYNTFTVPNQGSNPSPLPNIPTPTPDSKLSPFVPIHQGYPSGSKNIEHTQFLTIPQMGGNPYGSPGFVEAGQCMPGQYKFVGCLSLPMSLTELQNQCIQRQAEIESLAASRTYAVPAKLKERPNAMEKGTYAIPGGPMANRTYTVSGQSYLPCNQSPGTSLGNRTYTIAGLGNSPWPTDQDPPMPIDNRTYNVAGPGHTDRNLNSALSTTISGISRVVANLQRTIDSANGELPTDPAELNL
ncbi:uncharacterized protein LOC119656969 [Hermetia illucens]|uniref:uncharacterized protein LOC119656969 n=1 Tax=Hermetia illucens TaxID=343691 RepID=UPI0018CBFE0D|nr:uncharacterized protein LOC119656969 [Hermetia illucens]